MKKELQKAGVAMAIAMTCFSGTTFGESLSTEGSRSVVAHGRAILSVEDLKTLLGLKSRVPSDDQSSQRTRLNQAESSGAYSLHFDLSKADRRQILHAIRDVETERDTLIRKNKKDNAKKKEVLRKGRKNIQTGRTSAVAGNDADVAHNLLESLLSEANLDATNAAALAAFDREHTFVIEFQKVDDERHAQSIMVGENILWNAKTSEIAQR